MTGSTIQNNGPSTVSPRNVNNQTGSSSGSSPGVSQSRPLRRSFSLNDLPASSAQGRVGKGKNLQVNAGSVSAAPGGTSPELALMHQKFAMKKEKHELEQEHHKLEMEMEKEKVGNNWLLQGVRDAVQNSRLH